MKKNLIYSAIFIQTLCTINCRAQSFFPLPPGFNSIARAFYYDSVINYLYAGGNFSQLANGTPMKGISRWNGTNWDSLGSEFYGLTLTITKYNGFIYAGGSCSIKDSTGNYIPCYFGYWNGTKWIIPPGGGANSTVWELYVNGNDLYMGGAFDTINGVPAQSIARFDGVNWHTYPPITSGFHYVGAIQIYNNELYIGGNFSSGPGKNDILKFDGANWVSVGGGLSGSGSAIDAMYVYQGELYIVGLFRVAWGDPGNCIAKWNGTNWSTLGTGAASGQLSDIFSFNNELYVGGNFFDIGGSIADFAAKWDGSAWNGFGGTFDNGVSCFASDGSNLFIGGGFHTVNGDTMNFITQFSPPLEIKENILATKNEISITSISINGSFSVASLQYPIEDIIIFDLFGKVIFTKDKIFKNNYECKLNTPDGIYIAEVFINGNPYTTKVVITH